SVAVLVGERRLPAAQLDFLELVVAAEAEVELVAARHRIHGETELDVAATPLRRAALDVAHLVHGVVVFDHVTFLDVVGFHAGSGWEFGLREEHLLQEMSCRSDVSRDRYTAQGARRVATHVAPTGMAGRPYFGARRVAPSRRIVSPLR